MTNCLFAMLALAGGQIAANAAETAADSAHDSSRWEPAIARFEVADARQAPPQHAILFVGSSSIVRWDLEKWFPELETINRGFGGSQMADAVHFAERIVIPHRPRVVVVYSGDNDIAAGKSADEVHADFVTLVEKVHAEMPATKIVVLSIKPSTARWKLADTMQEANALIAATCAETDGVEFLDVWEPMMDGNPGPPSRELFVNDGLHLSDAGYQLWTELLMPHLSE
jgi:lysophospholipase L1-like esterase